MIKKLAHILIGWGKRFGILQTSKAEEKLAELRLKICGPCGYSKESKVLKILNGHATYEAQLQCTKCGCPCWEKAIVVDEECPIKRW